jgi:GT2 family glycosyltransferase
MDSGKPPTTVEALIVTYNTRDLLRQTVTTLLAHAPPASVATVTVSVFDNASHDGTADMVATELPEVRLIRSAVNVGFAAANNTLATTSSSTYLLIVNPDVIFVEDVVTPLLSALERDPRTSVVGPRLTFPDGAPQDSSQEFPTLAFELARALRGTKIGALVRPFFDAEACVARVRQHALRDHRVPRHTAFLWATCWLVRRAEVDRHGLFDERFSTYDEDLDFCRRLRVRGGCVVYLPGARLVHLGGQSSTSRTKEALMRRGRSRYFREHHGRRGALAYLCVIRPLVAAKRVWPGSAVSAPRR